VKVRSGEALSYRLNLGVLGFGSLSSGGLIGRDGREESLVLRV
jgi:hypothetical protein